MRIFVSLAGLISTSKFTAANLPPKDLDEKVLQVGPLILTKRGYPNDVYTVSWLSKLTQVSTILHKRPDGTYSVRRSWKQKKHVGETLEEIFTHKKHAISYFLFNTDTLKLREDIVVRSNDIVKGWIQELEEIDYPIVARPGRMQARIGYPVLVGENKEREGIVLKMLPPKNPNKPPLVELRLSSGPQTGRIIKVAANKVWIE